jgi:hypothetical protein
LIGTHTSNDEQNYLQIASVSIFIKFIVIIYLKVKIPLESSKDTRDYKENAGDDNTNGIGGSGITKDKQTRIQIDI